MIKHTLACIYSSKKPDLVEADEYLSLEKDIAKMIHLDEHEHTKWIIDYRDTNAIEFMDKIFSCKIHPHAEWGIAVPDTKVETQKKIPYSYHFLIVK
jgi:rhamnose utilization protein RhaD (predicted bifunctional aldolase and dehydrogenase)